ncbi:MAG TPA: hypothetical protein VF981_13500, partial [Gemmatimonadaceae bacterium]
VAGCSAGGEAPSGPGVPAIRVGQTSVELASKLGATEEATEIIEVTNGGSGQLTGLSVSEPSYSDPEATDWLSASLSSFTAPSFLTLAARVSTLSPGTHSATLTVNATAEGLANGPVTVNVTFVVTQEPVISVTSSLVSFEAIRGDVDPAPITLSVSNGGTGALDGLAVEGISYGNDQAQGWLTASLGATSAPAVLSLTPTLGSLPVGQYQAQVLLKSTASGIVNSPHSVAIELTIYQPPTIEFSSSTVAFNGQRLEPDPGVRTVAITNSGAGMLSGLAVDPVSYAPGQPNGWLSASLDRSVAPATLAFTANTTTVPAGSYSATIAVTATAPLVVNSPRLITVTFIVAPATARLAAQGAPPVGQTATKLGQAIRIRILDGEVDTALTAFGSPVTATFPIAGAMTGRTTVTPVNGEAVFDSLLVNAAGTYPVAFGAFGALPTTLALTVAPPPGGTLAAGAQTSAIQEPGDVVRITQLVEVRSAAGVPVSYPVQVRVVIARGTGILVSGDTTTSVAGVATFPNLRMIGKGDGFTAEFVAAGFASATRDYFLGSAVGGAFPRLLNLQDSVVARDAVFEVDFLASVSTGTMLGSLHWDVVWDPDLLSLVADSVLATGMAVLTNGTGAGAGIFGATVSSTSGILSATRLIRMRFKVVATVPSHAAIQSIGVEARSTTGVPLRTFKSPLTVRIP